MRARRGATGLCGILAVDKPAGMTSHDVVASIRRATGEKRIGHAGTLDPMATGLLVVLVGAYTRLEPFLSSATKVYRARIAFGSATDTEDAEGDVVATMPVPDGVRDPEQAAVVLDSFLGESMQRPPIHSAIKVGGVTAHRAARAGKVIEIAPRPIRVEEARLESLDAESTAWDVVFTVSKGTYIRSLARDIGEAAGTVAHLASLRRSSSGNVSLQRDGHALDVVAEAAAADGLAELFLDPFVVLGLPIAEAEPSSIADGRSLSRDSAPSQPDGSRVAIRAGGRLAAVYRTDADALRPEAVFACGIPR